MCLYVCLQDKSSYFLFSNPDTELFLHFYRVCTARSLPQPGTLSEVQEGCSLSDCRSLCAVQSVLDTFFYCVKGIKDLNHVRFCALFSGIRNNAVLMHKLLWIPRDCVEVMNNQWQVTACGEQVMNHCRPAVQYFTFSFFLLFALLQKIQMWICIS